MWSMPNPFNTHHYDTVIFDLGQVIVDLNGKAVIDKLKAISSKADADYKELIVSSPLLQLYETGKITEADFKGGMKDLLEVTISDEEFDNIWNAMLERIPVDRLELMRSLGESYQTMILSNTNRIHERRFDKMVGELMPGVKMKDLVHHAHYSHDLGYRKPDPAIYSVLIERHELIPERTIFLDDMTENVAAARALGIEAIQVAYPDQIFEILKHDE